MGSIEGGCGASFETGVLLTTCDSCKRLHPAQDPLEFNPLCPACAGIHPLGSLEMRGPFPLTAASIDDVLTRRSPGNFALGYMDDETFVVFYVGRADADVKRRLHDWVGSPSRYERYASGASASWGFRSGGATPLGAPALQRVGPAVDSAYTRFAFSYATSAESAFEKECRNFHDFGGGGGLDSGGHPEARPGSGWACPVHGPRLVTCPV
jgi:hypothetical protein